MQPRDKTFNMLYFVFSWVPFVVHALPFALFCYLQVLYRLVYETSTPIVRYAIHTVYDMQLLFPFKIEFFHLPIKVIRIIRVRSFGFNYIPLFDNSFSLLVNIFSLPYLR